MALRAERDAMRAIALDVMDPADKAAMLEPVLAEAMVNCSSCGRHDYFLRHDTAQTIKDALFRMGCVGRRGPADHRYWLGPYGSKVRKALLGDGG